MIEKPRRKYRADFNNYCASLARGMVSILFKQLSDVPQGLKEKLWIYTKNAIQIPDDYKKKAFVLYTIGTAWWRHKVNISEKFTENVSSLDENMPYEDDTVRKELEANLGYTEFSELQVESEKTAETKSHDKKNEKGEEVLPNTGMISALCSSPQSSGATQPFNYEDPEFEAGLRRAITRVLNDNPDLKLRNADAMVVDTVDESVNFFKSCCESEGPDLLAGLEGVIKCNFALLIKGKKVIAAHGIVYLNKTMAADNYPIPPQNVLVCRDGYETEYGHFEVPVPTDYVNLLSEAAASVVRWPRHLVIPKQCTKAARLS